MALGNRGGGGLDDFDGAVVDGLEEAVVEGAGAVLGVVGLDLVNDGFGGVDVDLEAAGGPEHELDDALDEAGEAGALDGALGVGELVAGDGVVVALDGDGDDAAGVLGRFFLDAAEFQEGGLEARVEGRHELDAGAGAIMRHGWFSLLNGLDVQLLTGLGVLVELKVDGFDAERGEFLPSAAGEVGHLDGGAVVGVGDLGEFGDDGPLAGLVDVDVQREAFLQAVAEAQVHEEVHAAVAAETLGELAGFLPEGMTILRVDFAKLLFVGPAEVGRFVLGIEGDAQGIILEDAPGGGWCGP